MKHLFLLAFLFLSGCSLIGSGEALLEMAVAEFTNTDVSSDSVSCLSIKYRCSSDNYTEWYRNDGTKSCACNN